MYMPPAFREERLDVLFELMRQYSFATLLTQHEGLPVVSHVPLLLRADEGPYGTLWGHLARANPQWRTFDPERPALAIFQGPHAYISPSWYGVQPSVPTWNYAVVHAYGVPRVIEAPEALYDLLQTLVQTYEAPRPQPWSLALPEAYLQDMMRGIVGFTMQITCLEGKYKLSQNRSEDDRLRVVTALRQQGDALRTAVATLMTEQDRPRP